MKPATIGRTIIRNSGKTQNITLDTKSINTICEEHRTVEDNLLIGAREENIIREITR